MYKFSPKINTKLTNENVIKWIIYGAIDTLLASIGLYFTIRLWLHEEEQG